MFNNSDLDSPPLTGAGIKESTMIFLNKGEDYRTHECVTREEAELMGIKTGSGPNIAQGQTLRRRREKYRVTVKKFSEASAKVLPEPLTLSGVCDIEQGRVVLPDINMNDLWTKIICMALTMKGD